MVDFCVLSANSSHREIARSVHTIEKHGPTSEVLNMQPQIPDNVKSTVAEKLVGQMNEGTAIINDSKTNALIDTGSQATTISKDFYDQYLTD